MFIKRFFNKALKRMGLNSHDFRVQRKRNTTLSQALDMSMDYPDDDVVFVSESSLFVIKNGAVTKEFVSKSRVYREE